MGKEVKVLVNNGHMVQAVAVPVHLGGGDTVQLNAAGGRHINRDKKVVLPLPEVPIMAYYAVYGFDRLIGIAVFMSC